MNKSTTIPIPAPDTEEATFDIINYKTERRRAAADARMVVRSEPSHPRKECAEKRRRNAWRHLITLLVLATVATLSFLAAVPWSLLTHPATGYVVCIIGAVVMYAAGFLAAKATI